jgi:hypothetical protein
MRLVAFACVLGAACTGPSLRVDNPGGHTVLVDGVRTNARELPFRYYGTTAVDALPAPRPDGRPDWEHQPTRGMVPIEPPASGWLFPLDLPLELLDRLLHGRDDRTAHVVVDSAPPPAPDPEAADAVLAALVRRAHEARIAR